MTKVLRWLNIYKMPLIASTAFLSVYGYLAISKRFLISETISLSDLLSTAAIAITIVTFLLVKSWEDRKEAARKYKAFGLIKMTVLRSLKSEITTLRESIEKYYNLTDSQGCLLFLMQCSNFNIVAQGFHTDWIQGIYTPDFLDLIYSDKVFNDVSLLLQEMSIYKSTLHRLSVNATQLLFMLKNNPIISNPSLSERCQLMEESHNKTATKMLEYIENLEKELAVMFTRVGISEKEITR